MKEIKIKIQDDTAELIKNISQERNTEQIKIIKELINKGLIFEKKGLENQGFENKLENTQKKIEELKKELKNKEEKIAKLEEKTEKLNKNIKTLKQENRYLNKNIKSEKKPLLDKIKKLIFN